MPWQQVQVVDQRIRFALEAGEADSCMAAVCRKYGISRETGYKWLQRYRELGPAGLMQEMSRRPHSSPRQSPVEVVNALKAARLARPDWGARKLAHVLKSQHQELPAVSTSTLQRILDREGLIAKADRQQIAHQRFQRERPNELWQMDFKGPQGFHKGIGPLSIQDDFSRYLVALRQLPRNDGKHVRASLETTFQEYGVPECMLMDHGTPWYDNFGVWGWTELSVWIMRQGVRIYLSGIRHPQTQGKVERMHGALQRATRKRKPAEPAQTWLDQFRQEYNQVRPHEGIGMVTPATRWVPSTRKFQEKIEDWQYPSDWITKRLYTEGHLYFDSQRWEISRALRGQLIGLQMLDNCVLVHFCNMPIRQLNLKTRTNVPIPGNPFRFLQC